MTLLGGGGVNFKFENLAPTIGRRTQHLESLVLLNYNYLQSFYPYFLTNNISIALNVKYITIWLSMYVKCKFQNVIMFTTYSKSYEGGNK